MRRVGRKLELALIAVTALFSMSSCGQYRTEEQKRLTFTENVCLDYMSASKLQTLDYDQLKQGEIGYVVSQDSRTKLYDISFYEKTPGTVNKFKIYRLGINDVFKRGAPCQQLVSNEYKIKDKENMVILPNAAQTGAVGKKAFIPAFFIKYEENFPQPSTQGYNHLFTIRGIADKEGFEVALGSTEGLGDGYYKNNVRQRVAVNTDDGREWRYQTVLSPWKGFDLESFNGVLHKVMSDEFGARQFMKILHEQGKKGQEGTNIVDTTITAPKSQIEVLEAKLKELKEVLEKANARKEMGLE